MARQPALLHFDRREDWRAWLEAHHAAASEAWLVLFKARHRQGRLSLEQAVEEALCFGWIDGKLKSLDAQRYALRFTPRRPNSVWSVSNIQRVERLIRQGRMAPAGLARAAQGRQSRQWEAARAREQTQIIPQDLATALRRKAGATAAYRRLAESEKKQLLHWLHSAKRPETRRRRIDAIVARVSG